LLRLLTAAPWPDSDGSAGVNHRPAHWVSADVPWPFEHKVGSSTAYNALIFEWRHRCCQSSSQSGALRAVFEIVAADKAGGGRWKGDPFRAAQVFRL